MEPKPSRKGQRHNVTIWTEAFKKRSTVERWTGDERETDGQQGRDDGPDHRPLAPTQGTVRERGISVPRLAVPRPHNATPSPAGVWPYFERYRAYRTSRQMLN